MLETTRLVRDLVALPSVNPMGRALSGPDIYEHRVSAYLEDFFRSLGVPYVRQEVAPQRDNLLAVFDPPGARSTLILEAHQDTVPTDHMTIEPFAARIESGRLHGRGACDIKGGMAAMLGAFARLVRERPAGAARVVMACSVDEEHTFLGVQELVKLRGPLGLLGEGGLPARAVVAEPTCLDIVDAHKGATRWTVTSTGRACHSSRPEQGVNAIYHMAGLLQLIEKYAAQLQAGRAHPRLGPPTLSVGRIEGGTSVNTVPDRCTIEIDRRLLPGESPDAAPADLLAFLKAHADSRTAFTFSEPWIKLPALGNEDSAALSRDLGTAIDSCKGSHQVLAVPYGTDASTLAQAGIPSVVFGPGDISLAHTCDEWVPLDEVEQASEILYRLARAG